MHNPTISIAEQGVYARLQSAVCEQFYLSTQDALVQLVIYIFRVYSNGTTRWDRLVGLIISRIHSLTIVRFEQGTHDRNAVVLINRPHGQLVVSMNISFRV